MEKLETKYAELDEFLTTVVYPNDLVKHLTDLREQCTYIVMRLLIENDPADYHIENNITDQLYYLKRIIEIFSNIKNN